MGLKKGDIIDEHKHHPDSCGLMMKVMAGGEGFEKIICCGHTLTEADVTPTFSRGRGRKRGKLLPAVLLDEKKLYPHSCGLRVMIMDGGAGFQELICCGHSLSLTSVKEFKYGDERLPQALTGERGTAPDTGPTGHA